METVSELSSRARETAERLGHPVYGAGIDPSAAGKRSTKAARQLAKQRRLEAKIEAGKNGQAQAFLLKLWLEREAELAAARIAADRDVVELEEWGLRAREDLEQALAELRQVDEQLERQRAELERASKDEQQLEALLRAADGSGLLERVLVRMNFITVVEDDE
jgi:hypothetical protein